MPNNYIGAIVVTDRHGNFLFEQGICSEELVEAMALYIEVLQIGDKALGVEQKKEDSVVRTLDLKRLAEFVHDIEEADKV
jgi:hypothetical protein